MRINDTKLDFNMIWFPSGLIFVILYYSVKRTWLIYLMTFVIINQCLFSSLTQFSLMLNIILVVIPLLIVWMIKMSYWQSKLDNLLFGIITIIIFYGIESGVILFFNVILDIDVSARFYFSIWVANVATMLYASIMFTGLISGFQQLKQFDIRKYGIMFSGSVLLILISWLIFSEPFSFIRDRFIDQHYHVFYILLTFVPLIFVVLLTLFFKELGRGVSLLLLGCIVILCTYLNKGPFLLPELRSYETILIAQVYLSFVSILLLLLSVLHKPMQISFLSSTSKLEKAIRYQFNTSSQSVIFDHNISDVIKLERQSSLKTILSEYPSLESYLRQYWLDVKRQVGEKTIYRFYDEFKNLIIIEDTLLVRMTDENELVMLGEWIIFCSNKESIRG